MSETAEFDVQDFENPNSNKGLHARFYSQACRDEVASAEAGMPKFKDVVYVEIRSPGNTTSIIRRPARDADKRRFARIYEAFVAGDLEQLDGTPLTEVTWIPRSLVEELQFVKVRTLEQLAEVNDQVCTRSPGIFELKRKAQAWLENAKQSAPFTKMYKENEELKTRMEQLEATIAAMATKGKKGASEAAQEAS